MFIHDNRNAPGFAQCLLHRLKLVAVIKFGSSGKVRRIELIRIGTDHDDVGNRLAAQFMCNLGDAERPIDWLSGWAVTLANAQRWRQQPQVDAWLKNSRLNTVGVLLDGAGPVDPAQLDLLRLSGAKAQAAVPNLRRLMASLQSPGADTEARGGRPARPDPVVP